MEAYRPFLISIVQSAFAIIIGLLVGGALIAFFGYNPLKAFIMLFKGAFGGLSETFETLAYAVPFMLTAVPFAIGVQAGLFNIGAEGQMYLGAVAAVAIGGAVSMPPYIHLICSTVFSMIIGAVWAYPAAILKIKRGVHEVISTIMFNWIAFWLSIYLIVYHLAEPGRAERSLPILPTSRYTVLYHGSTLTTVIFVSAGFCILLYFFLKGTKIGYEMRAAGANPDAARYAGININKAIVLSFIIGGMASGLAGASQILGRPPAWSLYATLGNVVGIGFDGIGVALIGRNDPIGGIFASIFYGALLNGGRYMEYYVGVPSELIRAVNGLIVLALASPEIISIIRRRIRR